MVGEVFVVPGDGGVPTVVGVDQIGDGGLAGVADDALGGGVVGVECAGDEGGVGGSGMRPCSQVRSCCG